MSLRVVLAVLVAAVTAAAVIAVVSMSATAQPLPGNGGPAVVSPWPDAPPASDEPGPSGSAGAGAREATPAPVARNTAPPDTQQVSPRPAPPAGPVAVGDDDDDDDDDTDD